MKRLHAEEAAELGRWLRETSPEYDWDPPHLRLLQEELARVTAGLCERLMVFMPPRHGKSELLTVRYPVYQIEKQNKRRVIVGAYNQAWAERLQTGDCKVQSANWDGAGCELPPGNLQIEICNSQFAIPSDPLGRQEGAPLWPERFNEAALHRIRTALGTRSFAALYQGRPMPAEGGLFKREWFKIVNVLPEPLPEPPAPAAPPAPKRPGFRIPELPPDATPLERRQLERAIARGDYDPLPPFIPDRERADYEFELHRRRMAELQASQVGTVSPCSGMYWVRFWDTAAKAGQRCDYWAGALLVRLPDGDWYLVDVVRGRWEYPEAKRRVLETAARDGTAVPVVIEESANGIALLQDLAADPRADGYWIRAERAVGDKVVRAGAWSSAAEMGRFHLVRSPWNAAFLTEVEEFPHGGHDDQVDAVSGAYGYLFRQSRRARVISLAGRAR